MKIFLLISVFVGTFGKVLSQECTYCNNDPVYTKLINEADTCLKNHGTNCVNLFEEILEKGRREQVEFVDFLYLKYIRSFYAYEKYDSSLYHGYEALKEPFEFEADVFNLMGNSFMMLGKIDSSIHYLIKSAHLLEKQKDSLFLSYVYTNLGVIIGEMGNTPLSIDYHKKSYSLQEQLNMSEFLSTAASNIALGYFHQNDEDSTRIWANKSIAISDTTNDIIGRLHGYYALAMIEKDINKGLNYAKETMDLALKSNQKNVYADALYLYALKLNLLGRSREAMTYAEDSYKMSLEVNKLSGIMKSAGIAADIYYENQVFDKAAQFYRIYNQYKDSLLTEENRMLVSDLTTKYKTEKKENQILENELLINKKNNQIRLGINVGVLLMITMITILLEYKRRQKNKIEKIEKEKEITVLRAWMNGEERERNRISRELHDGVASMITAAKLNLQTIPYLSHDKAETKLHKVSNILETTHNDVRRIAHNLLPVVLEQEGLERAIEEFISNINETGALTISYGRTGESTQPFIFGHVNDRIVQVLAPDCKILGPIIKVIIFYMK